ncbi:MAG: hypothetical protein VX112_01280 [Pseudomonadota bacterium]|nr:hypothetical protein [Pseudomonadota bacterium]
MSLFTFCKEILAQLKTPNHFMIVPKPVLIPVKAKRIENQKSRSFRPRPYI